MAIKPMPSHRQAYAPGPERILRLEWQYGNLAKWGLLLASLLAWSTAHGAGFLAQPGRVEAHAALVYGALNLLFSLVFIPPRRLARWHLPILPLAVRRAFLICSYLVDHLYISVLIATTGGFQSDFYLLFALLALKAAVYYPQFKEPILLSFLSGVFLILASYISAGSFYFLTDRVFFFRYGILFVFILCCLGVGWLMERRQRSITTLDANLSRQSQDLEAQAHLLQRTAGDLANRLLELRSLQEGFKAINSALTLDELLQLIVENATQVLRGARCTIGLCDEERQNVVIAAAAGIPRDRLWGTAFRKGEGVAGWVLEHRRPALIHAVGEDPRFRRLGEWPIASMVCVPLFSEGQIIGVLTATSPQPRAFSEADVNLLDAFGDQVAVAVKNARLYEQLRREEQETARLYRSVLEKSTELEAILRGIGDGVIVIDPQQRLLMMNPIAAKMFRIHQAPQPGVRLPEIISHEGLLALAQEALSSAEGPLIREIAVEREGDRVEIYQALSTTVSAADGAARGAVMVLRDVTSQKELEQMKSNFLSVVSHELRTPLHSIKGFVEIILMGKTGEINELQRDFLTTVKDATTNLQRLIDDLLEFSRMEAGRIKLKPEMISIFDVAEKVVEQLSPLAAESKLRLLNNVPEDIPLIEADPMRIEQVLINLISNACKFTPAEGRVTIAAEDLGAWVQVSVTDTGIGIPKEEQAKIFQRFYQVDSGATRAYRGAGLGLTICKFIVEYHRGRIWVESEEGQGSSFRFVLPKKLPKDEDLVIDFTIPANRHQAGEAPAERES